MPRATGRTPQFEIYALMRDRGVEVDIEVRLPALSEKSRSGYFDADLAVYRRGKLKALCECKRKRTYLTGRQAENYERSGYPYIVATNDNIEEAAAWLEKQAWGDWT